VEGFSSRKRKKLFEGAQNSKSGSTTGMLFVIFVFVFVFFINFQSEGIIGYTNPLHRCGRISKFSKTIGF
jgi:hypothetical protein